MIPSDRFVSVLSDYDGSVGDRQKKFFVDLGYEKDLSLDDYLYQFLGQLGYRGSIGDRWNKYLSSVSTTIFHYAIGGSAPSLIIDNTEGFYLDHTSTTYPLTFTRASEGYALDANGIWQKSLTNEPRFDWSTGKRAQLIEAQTQNYVWNSGLSGAAAGVVGAGGALPSGWIVGLFDTVEVLEIGTYRGVPAIRLALSYANSSGSNAYPDLGKPYGLSGRADTTTYTVSSAARFVSITGALDVPKLQAKDLGGTISNFAIGSFTNSGDWEEIAKTGTTGTGGSSLGFSYVFAVADGNTLSVDAWFAMPQLELGATRTSFIQTPVGSGATRAADLTSKDLSGYDFSTGITVLFEGNLGAAKGSFDRLLELTNGTSANRIGVIYNAASSSIVVEVYAGGVSQTYTLIGVSAGNNTRIAVSFSAAGDVLVIADGVTKLSEPGKTMPSINKVNFGSSYTNTGTPAILHHYETLIKEGPSTEAELKALTA